MKATIRKISATDSIKAAGSLLLEHWQEVAQAHAGTKVEPNITAYSGMERAGILISLGAFVDGQLVGYAVSTIAPCLHYARKVEARNMVLFVKKERRGSGIGGALVRETERLAAEGGASQMHWAAKPGSELEAKLRASGLEVEEVIFVRQLDREAS